LLYTVTVLYILTIYYVESLIVFNLIKQFRLSHKILTLVIILVLSLGIFLLPVSAQSLFYAGSIGTSPNLSANDPFCNVPNQPYTYGGDFTVDTTDIYNYYDNTFYAGTYDVVMLLYTSPLNPANPSSNLVVAVDDTDSFTLSTGTTYYLYLIPFCASGPGNFGFTLSGTGNISFNPGPGISPDADSDTIPDSTDNCPSDANADQSDTDSDGTGDACDSTPTGDSDSDGIDNALDNCPAVANSGQTDTDSDGVGDVCDSTPTGDTDSDGIDNATDNCPSDANASQTDTDSDGTGDACDSTPTGDSDSDGVDNATDNCPTTANASQTDTDSDGVGDACDSTPNGDSDSDGIDNSTDNCPTTANASQTDTDSDGTGDACDSTPTGDTDSDGIDNATDNCPTVANASQTDTDSDGVGDVCDTTPSGDTDSDGVDNAIDNCPTVANPAQADSDGDGLGNRCDSSAQPDTDKDGVADNNDTCPLLGDLGFGVQANGCPPNIVLPPDNRINWQYGDLNTVLYATNGGLAAYCYNGNTWLGMFINQTIVDAWDASQAQDVPVVSIEDAGCHAAFYILDNGQYQVNIWSFEGKRYEIIADNLSFEGATMRYFDPNE
jgi:hypothetical protein